MEKSLERAERWRHEALLVGEGGADGSSSPRVILIESKVLQHVLAESQRSIDRTWLSSGGRAARAVNEDGAVQRRLASLPVRRPSAKRSCTADHGGQGLSSSTLSSPSFVDL